MSGERRVGDFLEYCRSTGAPAEWYGEARAAGPLAEFNRADHWVDKPARDGVVLIGDAAAATDPDWGTGLSLTLLDVLNLRDSLCSTSDWDTAIQQYSLEHDRYYGALHTVTRCYADLLWSTGQKAEERRQRVLPRLLTHPRGIPDLIGLGPESPIDARARRLFFGEEEPEKSHTIP